MSISLGSNILVATTLPLDAKSIAADVTARDAIVAGLRYEGMQVYCEAEETNYQLQGGIDNADWVEIGTGGGGGSGGEGGGLGTAVAPYIEILHVTEEDTDQDYELVYCFVSTSGVPVVGDIYEHNSEEYTILAVVGNSVYASGTGAPNASGTLTGQFFPGTQEEQVIGTFIDATISPTEPAYQIGTDAGYFTIECETPHAFWFDERGDAVAPTLPGYTLVEVDIQGMTAAQICTAIAAAINGSSAEVVATAGTTDVSWVFDTVGDKGVGTDYIVNYGNAHVTATVEGIADVDNATGSDNVVFSVSATPAYLRIKAAGGGGGGATSSVAGGTGNNTTFNGTGGSITVYGGSGGGTGANAGGAMGSAAFSGVAGINMNSIYGYGFAARGGMNPLGFGFGGNGTTGSAGGAGGAVDLILPTPSGTYVYKVGYPGTAASGGFASAGSPGAIIVESHY